MRPRVAVLAVVFVSLISTLAVAQSTPVISLTDNNPIPIGYSNCFYGSGFGATQGTSMVSINGTSIAPDSWADSTVCLAVPSNTAAGPATIQISTGAGQSNLFNVTITGQPTITSISPARGQTGTPVTITGVNFGDIQYSNSFVSWNA